LTAESGSSPVPDQWRPAAGFGGSPVPAQGRPAV